MSILQNLHMTRMVQALCAVLLTVSASYAADVDLSTLTDSYTAQDGDVLLGTLGGNYQISIADGATVTLDGVTIDGENDEAYKWAGLTCLGDCTIKLAEGSENKVKGFYKNYPGVYVPMGSTLTIEGMGTLDASSNGLGAGIGGSSDLSCGNIVISGGTVTATGGTNAAGIGGAGEAGSSSSNTNFVAEDITINGGTVTAKGGNNAAGIGSSYGGTVGAITISGGSVTAEGGLYAAGIGSGWDGSAGNITINGGTVNVTGGYCAAGIGSGRNGAAGNITITDGVTKVTVEAGPRALYSVGKDNEGSVGTITIGGVESGSVSTKLFEYPVTETYTVAFDENGGSGTMGDQTVYCGFLQALNANTFTREGYRFVGWNTKADGTGVGYEDLAKVENLAEKDCSITLYAQWYQGNLGNLKNNYTIKDGETVTGTYSGNYKISIADGATVTLDGVTINGENDEAYEWAGLTCDGDCTIKLAEDSKNTVKGFYENYPGIYVPEGKTLTIDGTGFLDASSNGYGAGIGCGYEISCGNIVIKGGEIKATGGSYAAGIGSGESGRAGAITISGSTVTATGGDAAAGIGSGKFGSAGDITITDGVTKVTATAGSDAPNSVGAGTDGSAGVVTVAGVETGNINESPFVVNGVAIQFDANDGSGSISDMRALVGYTNLSPNTFTREGYAFTGWNTVPTPTAEEPGVSYADEAQVENLTDVAGDTVTLYAQWIKTLTHDDIAVASVAEQIYTGSEITPAIAVKDGKTSLVQGKDFTVAYSGNKNVGTAKATLTGKGKYYGEVEVEFTIAKASAKLATAPSAVKDLAYTGKSQTLVKAGKAEHGTLLYKLGKDGEYSEKLPTAKDAGKYMVYYKVEGDTNYNGVTEASLTVEIAKASTKLVIAPNAASRLQVNQYEMERDYDLMGRRLQGKPKARGAYYGKKVLAK